MFVDLNPLLSLINMMVRVSPGDSHQPHGIEVIYILLYDLSLQQINMDGLMLSVLPPSFVSL